MKAETPPTPGEDRFWDLAEPLLGRTDVTRSTMMGFPCLRIRGQFFASADRATGALLVKLPEARVDELVHAGRAESFAPAYERARTWKRLLDEALEFVDALPPAKTKKKP